MDEHIAKACPQFPIFCPNSTLICKSPAYHGKKSCDEVFRLLTPAAVGKARNPAIPDVRTSSHLIAPQVAAAREAIGDSDFFLIARTDARATSSKRGLDEAINRANIYLVCSLHTPGIILASFLYLPHSLHQRFFSVNAHKSQSCTMIAFGAAGLLCNSLQPMDCRIDKACAMSHCKAAAADAIHLPAPCHPSACSSMVLLDCSKRCFTCCCLCL